MENFSGAFPIALFLTPFGPAALLVAVSMSPLEIPHDRKVIMFSRSAVVLLDVCPSGTFRGICWLLYDQIAGLSPMERLVSLVAR